MTREHLSTVADAVAIITGLILAFEALHRLMQ